MEQEQTTNIKSIGFFLQSPKTEVKKKGRREQERDAPFNELYQIYCSVTQRKLRRIENWKRYVGWLKENRMRHAPDAVAKFRKTKKGKDCLNNYFIREFDLRTFAIKTSHISTHDLYYCLSIARDKEHRGEPVGAWLFQQPKSSSEVIHT